MAKPESPLDDDFEQLARHVDQASRFLPLKSEEGTRSADDNVRDLVDKETAIGGTKPSRARRTRPKPTSQGTHRPKNSPTDWGPPTALFNTRIPQSMSDQLDDLAYKLKKAKVLPATKQALAQEALEDLLRKHGMLRP